jgi:stress-induced morphogen
MQIQETLTAEIKEHFSPTHLEVTNESFMHAVPNGSETHFKIVIVSENFIGQKLLQRHREVQSKLKTVLQKTKAVHLITLNPTEWEAQKESLLPSPTCAGSKK